MARSSSRGAGLIVQLDRAVLVALATGLALYVMPFWAEGRLRAAFWVTLGATVLHIYTSHKRASATRKVSPQISTSTSTSTSPSPPAESSGGHP